MSKNEKTTYNVRKSKKITFNMINETLPEIEEKEVVIDEERGLIASVKPMLGFSDAMNFVRSVSDNCFDVTGQYLPEFFDFVVAINVMMYFAGFDAPKDYEKAYHVLMLSDVYRMVLAEIDQAQLEALVDAAKRRISHKREEMIQANVIKMNDLIAEVSRMVEESNEATRTINSGEFQNTMESLLSVIGTQKAAGTRDEASPGNGEEPNAETGELNIVPFKRGE